MQVFRPGMQTLMPLSFNASLTQSTSLPRSASTRSAFGALRGACGGSPVVADWPGRDTQADRAALSIRNSVAFLVHTAFRVADQTITLIFGQPFTRRPEAVR